MSLRRMTIVALLAAGVAAALLFIFYRAPDPSPDFARSVDPQTSASGSWRYKMTVVVDTPEGEKSGFAVREMSNSASIRDRKYSLPQSTNPADVTGEAVVVDLGERGILFGILKSSKYGEDYAENVLYRTIGGNTTVGGIDYLINLKEVRADLKVEDWPMFVTFTDMMDPKSVTPVLKMGLTGKNGTGDWIVTEDRTEELFGEGVKIKEVIIEMTDEPVTWGIERDLPWLPARKNVRGALGGSSEPPYDDPTGTYLKGNHFSKGRFW